MVTTGLQGILFACGSLGGEGPVEGHLLADVGVEGIGEEALGIRLGGIIHFCLVRIRLGHVLQARRLEAVFINVIIRGKGRIVRMRLSIIIGDRVGPQCDAGPVFIQDKVVLLSAKGGHVVAIVRIDVRVVKFLCQRRGGRGVVRGRENTLALECVIHGRGDVPGGNAVHIAVLVAPLFAVSIVKSIEISQQLHALAVQGRRRRGGGHASRDVVGGRGGDDDLVRLAVGRGNGIVDIYRRCSKVEGVLARTTIGAAQLRFNRDTVRGKRLVSVVNMARGNIHVHVEVGRCGYFRKCLSVEVARFEAIHGVGAVQLKRSSKGRSVHRGQNRRKGKGRSTVPRAGIVSSM